MLRRDGQAGSGSDVPTTLGRAVMFFGAAPLCAGCTIFALWFALRSCWLMTAGLLTVLLGLISLLAGLVTLGTYLVAGLRDPSVGKGAVLLRSGIRLALLLVDLPAAYLLMAAAIAIGVPYDVTIVNESAVPAESCRISGTDLDQALGTIPPGESRKTVFRHHLIHGVFFSARQSGRTLVDNILLVQDDDSRRVRIVRIRPNYELKVDVRATSGEGEGPRILPEEPARQPHDHDEEGP